MGLDPLTDTNWGGTVLDMWSVKGGGKWEQCKTIFLGVFLASRIDARRRVGAF